MLTNYTLQYKRRPRHFLNRQRLTKLLDALAGVSVYFLVVVRSDKKFKFLNIRNDFHIILEPVQVCHRCEDKQTSEEVN